MTNVKNYRSAFDANVENKNEQNEAQSKKNKKELAIKIGKYTAAVCAAAGTIWGGKKLYQKIRGKKAEAEVDKSDFEETK